MQAKHEGLDCIRRELVFGGIMILTQLYQLYGVEIFFKYAGIYNKN